MVTNFLGTERFCHIFSVERAMQGQRSLLET